MSKLRLNGSTSGYIELEAPAVADNGVLTLPTAAAGFGAAGIGANVVQTVKIDVFTTTSSTPVDVTGLSVTITPSSATSKVLIIADLQFSGSPRSLMYLLRGATSIYESTGASLSDTMTWNDVTLNARSHTSATKVFLDSPATTSATTYKIQMTDGKLNQWNLDTNFNSVSSITAIEVAA